MAIAHSIVVTAWHMATTGQLYEDLGADYYDTKTDPARQAARHVAQLQAAGYTVTITPAA